MKLRLLTLCIAGTLLAACGGDREAASADAGGEEKVLNVYNYSDYIAEDTIPNFEKQSGIKVTYDVFDSDEMVETKLLAGNSGYDVVVPTLNFFGRQIQAGVFLPLDKSKIPNLANLDPAVMKRIATQDPGNQYGVPYMIGTTGIGYNVDMLKERFGGSADIANSWDLVFKPENISKMKDCGVTILDTPADMIPIALHYLGLGPHSGDPADLLELDLAPLKIKVKQGGGTAGHNGLRSIDAALGPDFRRVRIGIGHPGHKDRVASYVLGNYAKAEMDDLAELLGAIGAEAEWLAAGDEVRFMNDIAMRQQP